MPPNAMKILHLATTYPLHAADSNAAFVEALAEALRKAGRELNVEHRDVGRSQ